MGLHRWVRVGVLQVGEYWGSSGGSVLGSHSGLGFHRWVRVGAAQTVEVLGVGVNLGMAVECCVQSREAII